MSTSATNAMTDTGFSLMELLVVLAIIAAAITPTVDPINMLLVWAPLVALYLLSVATALLAQHQRVRRRSQDL